MNGNTYNPLKAFYRSPAASVQDNDHRTGWSLTQSGVKQGDVLSPTLFAINIKNLAAEIS